MGNCVLSGGNRDVKCDLLWTNPNPTVEFSAQTITVNNLMQYDYMQIVKRAYLTGGIMTDIFYIVDVNEYFMFSSSNAAQHRSFTISENSISFSNSTYSLYTNGNTGTYNGANLPLKIYGIKL